MVKRRLAGCCGAGGSIDSSAALGMTMAALGMTMAALGMTMAALGMTMAALGMTRTGDGNLAHSAPLRTCFGWGVREISNCRLQISDIRDRGRKFQIGRSVNRC